MSIIWKHFKACSSTSEQEHKAECLVCDKDLTGNARFIVRGKTPRSYSTKPLWNHLQKKHPSTFKILKLKSKKSETSDEEHSDDPEASSSKLSKPLLQPTIVESIERSKKWTLDDNRSKNKTKVICEMMALDAEPFALVEREGFQRLLSTVAPRYPLPCRTHFSRKVMPEMHEELATKIRERLRDAESLSFTTDIWTNSANNEAFISLTAHFIMPSTMEQMIFTLATKHFPESHTGSNISEMLNQILNEWELKEEQLHVIVRDNAANMAVGTDMTAATGISCFIHTLQLVIHDAILSQRTVSDIIAKCRKIVTHFNHSAISCTKLKTIQGSLNLPIHKLIQDVVTRWNSTYYMLERLYEQRNAVTLYAAEHDIPTLTAYNWGLVENVIRVLKPFEEITKQASSDNELISFVIPAVTTLNSYLTKRQKDSGVQTLKDQLKQSLEKRFLKPSSGSSKSSMLEQKSFTYATLLDPRYKANFLKDIATIKEQFIDDLVANDQTMYSTDHSSTGTDDVQGQGSKTLQEDIHEDIWECFDEISTAKSNDDVDSSSSMSATEDHEHETMQASTSTDSNIFSPRQTKKKSSKSKRLFYSAEVDKYLPTKNISRISDPIKWWQNNIEQFISLKPSVLKYLSAPPSSVASERLVGAAGAVYADNRSALLPQNAEKFIFIMKNMKYMKL